MPDIGEIRTKTPALIRPPVGETYTCIESPRGELGFYIIADNSIVPYRYHVRAPSFLNLTTLCEMVAGWKIADAIVICGSIDICIGEADR